MMDQIARSPKQIGTLIRRIRKTKDLTQTELGEMTSLRQETISKIENGETGTKIGTLCDVLTALNLELVVRQRTTSSATDIEDIF